MATSRYPRRMHQETRPSYHLLEFISQLALDGASRSVCMFPRPHFFLCAQRELLTQAVGRLLAGQQRCANAAAAAGGYSGGQVGGRCGHAFPLPRAPGGGMRPLASPGSHRSFLHGPAARAYHHGQPGGDASPGSHPAGAQERAQGQQAQRLPCCAADSCWNGEPG